jgi:3-deoxy-D-manno-octulosonic-acid transferase
MSAGMIHQYVPLDAPGAVRRFVTHWRPDLAVCVESELWPNLILAAKRSGARLALLSARMSDASARRWSQAPGVARTLLGAFELILARDPQSADRLRALDGEVSGLADLKFGASALPVDLADLANARAALEGRTLLLAASTHPGEDSLILSAFAGLQDRGAGRLVIAPRHVARGRDIVALARSHGLTAGLRSAGARLGADEVHVADTLGEVGLWFRLAGLAVVGGSLQDGAVGGHNPLEPARLSCPFIAGQGVWSWPVYDALETAGGTAKVSGAELGPWFELALAASPRLTAMAKAARDVVAQGDAAAGLAAERVVDLFTR